MTTDTTARTPASLAGDDTPTPAVPTAGALGKRPCLIPLIPALTGLAVTLWGVTSPSLWRDEAVSVEVARYSLRDTFRTLADVDAVHALYYLLLHGVVHTFGGSELAVRFPSVLGAVAAAAGTAVLGRHLAGARTGLIAGLIVAASPTISRFAAEARSYAIVAGLAVWTTYLLVRAIDRPGRRTFAAYGGLLTLMGAVHLFSLLIVPAHAVAVWRTSARRASGDEDGEATRKITGLWFAALGAALLVIVPLGYISMLQRDQLDWLVAPGPRDVLVLVSSFAGSSLLVVPMAALLAFGMLRRPDGGNSRVDLRVLTVPWIIVPPAILLTVSLIHPYYVFRYVLLCVPAVALPAAAGLARLPTKPLVAVAAVLAALSIPGHLAVRAETSRMDDLRKLAAIVSTHKLPGDSIVFGYGGYRRITAAYPGAFAHLKDLSMAASPAESAKLGGKESSVAAFTRHLAQVDRVWYVDNYVVPGNRGKQSTTDRAKVPLIRRSPEFRLIGRWRYHGGTLYLYQHLARPVPAGG